MEAKVVFVDGYCVLCNGFATRILNHLNVQRLKVSTLQGETAKQMISKEIRESVDSVMYYRDGKLLVKSTAAIYIFSDLGGIGKLMRLLLIFPRFFRDWVYDIIARNRYEWFGKKDTCGLPTEAERKHILD